jgi:NAD(P)-dependent dehydrogenase (short-subunit alcohol dehydrogenase family)
MTTHQHKIGSGHGARVVAPARRPDAAREALVGIDGVEVDELDLGDLGSVRGFAERFMATGRHIHIVINSAGIMACPQTRVGPGWKHRSPPTISATSP